MSLSLCLALVTLVCITDSRVLDKNVYSGGPGGSKIFDYYDVAKGNIPATYLTSPDKLLEPYIDQREPIQIENYVDEKDSHLGPLEIAPAETPVHDTDSYDDYAEESINKPLTVVDSETGAEPVNAPEKEAPTAPGSPVEKQAPGVPDPDKDYYSTFDVTNTTSDVISYVDDEMILVTVRPLCDSKTQKC